MITPTEYFSLPRHRDACQPAREFCRQFATMREAWLSDEHAMFNVPWMLWVVMRLTSERMAKIHLEEFIRKITAQTDYLSVSAFVPCGVPGWYELAKDTAREHIEARVFAHYGEHAVSITPLTDPVILRAKQLQRAVLRQTMPDMFTEGGPS